MFIEETAAACCSGVVLQPMKTFGIAHEEGRGHVIHIGSVVARRGSLGVTSSPCWVNKHVVALVFKARVNFFNT